MRACEPFCLSVFLYWELEKSRKEIAGRLELIDKKFCLRLAPPSSTDSTCELFPFVANKRDYCYMLCISLSLQRHG
jgi:hypothetical protein